jgi:sec-independent protein translocase protein TatA
MNSILLFMGLGMQEMLLIGLVILIFFGAKKIPEFMKGLGKGVREFKDGIKEVKKDSEDSNHTSPTTTTTADRSRVGAETTRVDENRD